VSVLIMGMATPAGGVTSMLAVMENVDGVVKKQNEREM
jgi:hypothetical protein